MNQINPSRMPQACLLVYFGTVPLAGPIENPPAPSRETPHK